MNDNNSFNENTWQENVMVSETINQPEATTPPAPANKSSRKAAINSALFGLTGLIVGGLGVFGILQLVNNNQSKDCVECSCPKCPAQVASTDLNTAFLGLEPQGQNMLYSPLSIRYGLSLLDAGAAGETKSQIDNVLGDGSLPQYENIQDELSLANAVFIRDTYEDYVIPSYVNTVVNNYNADILYDDFSSTANMDNWIDNKTFGLINKIGINITDDTKMALANALAIQMDWAYKFFNGYTHGGVFYKADGSEIYATTMYHTFHDENTKYYTDDDITLLSLPLQPVGDTSLEFVAVMPSNDLEDYVSDIDLSAIDEAISNSISASTQSYGVEVYIPKFKYEYELDFANDLQSLGITQAFSPNANFSNMTNSPDGLYVGQAVHKANIDFSEDGIKAAAVTVFSMVANAAAIMDEPEPVVIHIDHPFLFLIRDKSDGTIWFIGTVYEPNLWADDEADYEPSGQGIWTKLMN